MSECSADSNSLAALARVGVPPPNRLSAVEQEVIQLFDQFRDRLLHYLLAFSLPIADSEDVLQETFLALFRHLQHGKSREHIGGWLFRVAHNLALKHRRNQRDHENVPEALIETANSLVCPAPNPEDRLIHSQAQERIAAALRALPEQNRWCLQLRAEGLRYREIAKVLDISLGSVAACLERSVTLIARAVER
jgi:RNA polymerase sigma-70 factor, ECF subfamily